MHIIPFAIIDTNVASNLADCATNPEINRLYKPLYQTVIEPSIALVSLEEIEYGMRVARWGERRSRAMRDILIQMDLLLPTKDVALVCAELRAQCYLAGRHLNGPDAWIAATALHYDIPILTDDADLVALEEYGLQILTSRT